MQDLVPHRRVPGNPAHHVPSHRTLCPEGGNPLSQVLRGALPSAHSGIDPSQDPVYLIGLCHLRREIRIFDIDRISLINPLEENFLIPDDFDFGEYTRHAFSVIIDAPVTVRVRFAPEIARYVAERQWHPSRKITKGPDGSVVLELTIGGTLEIKRWILSFGAQAEVLSPDKLIEEIRKDLEKMRTCYAPPEEQKSRGAG